MNKTIFCKGECNQPELDDYCGMYMEGEECPACKTIKESKE